MKEKLHLKIAQSEQLRAALRAAVSPPAPPSLSATSLTSDTSDGNPPSTPHLTDAEFFGLSLDQLSPQEKQAAAEHMSRCPACNEEWERLQTLNALWNEPAEVARLEARRRALASQPHTSLLQRLAEGMVTSLQALLPRQEAFAQGVENEEADVTFVIAEGKTVIKDLNGLLRRKNREFYARITADSEEAQQFAQRSVLITLQNAEGAPFLQRHLDVGVAVLLGTDLPLTTDSLIGAQLLPIPGQE